MQVGDRQSLHPYTLAQRQQVVFDVEAFYYRTLKFGLSHFAKNVTLFWEPLFFQCSSLQRLKKKFLLLSVVCRYLSKDKLHELNEDARITKLKRVKKRLNALVFKAHRNEKLVFGKQSQQQSKQEAVRPYYLRKALLYLICDELDKIKAFGFSKLNEELPSEFSLTNKVGDNFVA